MAKKGAGKTSAKKSAQKAAQKSAQKSAPTKARAGGAATKGGGAARRHDGAGAATQAGSGGDSGGEGRRYWLLKSEPGSFAFDDLMRAPGRTTHWDGVRNFQARNFLRDDMRVGDGVLFYHSSVEPAAVAGIAEVTRAGYADHTAFDPADAHYDAKSRPDEPTWYMVDVRAVERFDEPVTLAELRATPGLEAMALLQRGSRLSVQPVRAEEWEIVVGLGRRRGRA